VLEAEYILETLEITPETTSSNNSKTNLISPIDLIILLLLQFVPLWQPAKLQIRNLAKPVKMNHNFN
jgi:hypothetical protein